jgi:hypothetical protein
MIQALDSAGFEEECFAVVRSLFRTEEYVREWMRKEIPAFEYLTPIDYARKHGLDGLRAQVKHLKQMDSV